MLSKPHILSIFHNLFVWFDSFHPVNIFSVKSGRVFLGWTSTKQRIKCLAQGHNTVPPVRLEPALVRAAWTESTLFAYGKRIYLILHKWTWTSNFYLPTWKCIYIIIHSWWSKVRIFMKEMVNPECLPFVIKQEMDTGKIMTQVRCWHKLFFLPDPAFLICHVPVELPEFAWLIETSLSILGQLFQFLVSVLQSLNSV